MLCALSAKVYAFSTSARSSGGGSRIAPKISLTVVTKQAYCLAGRLAKSDTDQEGYRMNIFEAEKVLRAVFPQGSTVDSVVQRTAGRTRVIEVRSRLTPLPLNEPVALIAGFKREGKEIVMAGVGDQNVRMIAESLSWFLYGDATSLSSEPVYL